MLTLNDQNRSETKPLTVEEEKAVIKILNRVINTTSVLTIPGIKLLQKFINNYQNLSHYKSRTSNYDLLLKKVESQEKEISNLTTDVNVCGESLQREYKRNENLIIALKEIASLSPNGFDRMLNDTIKKAQQAIENNK